MDKIKLPKSEEHKKKISDSQKGKPRLYLVGHKTSEETKKKISNALRGNKNSIGHKLSEESKKKIGIKHKGKKLTDKTKRLISIKGIGRIPWNKGKRCEWVSKRNKINNPCKSGEKHWNWMGGKSFELYGFEWTNLLKHSIRTRDCFTCYICKKNGYDVHHIDYNKKNCNPNNLITLCRSCHVKTNTKRAYWQDYFIRVLSLT